MANASKKKLGSALKLRHWTKGIRFSHINNLGAFIIWQKEEKNVGKVIYSQSYQFITLL